MIQPDPQRSQRILNEYTEPEQRLLAGHVERAIVFFGSARLQPGQRHGENGATDYCGQARTLASRLAQWTLDTHAPANRCHVCTGGGPGIMDAANRGAADVDAQLSLGYNIALPHEQHANPYLNDAISFEFRYFFMRKLWLMNIACAIIAFPGGFGTLDELFEALNLMQTGKLARVPVVLFGSHFWNRLIDFNLFEDMQLISPGDRDLFQVVDTVAEAFAFLTTELA